MLLLPDGQTLLLSGAVPSTVNQREATEEIIDRIIFDDGTLNFAGRTLTGAGDDTETHDDSTTPLVLFAEDGNDPITGHDAADFISGGAGDDVLTGEVGDNQAAGSGDLIFGDSGDDTLHGSAEGDRLFGGRGADEINGGAGNDELHGGAGWDILRGGVGNDTLYLEREISSAAVPAPIRLSSCPTAAGGCPSSTASSIST